MYGKNAKFVDINNINIITKTLNELFLKKDLVSWKKIEEDLKKI